ncbi:hypothetical protein ACFP81_07655 [Deinococcus lacus]|uniref:Uncharacterized protein n=1 Tax=Deinococcus lacus TaxID=392561 RepID=A0ABW1YCT1_9DEIO
MKRLSHGEVTHPPSGRGYQHVCPYCNQPFGDGDLHDLRDGDQAYWCAECQKGHRAGDPPLEALQPAGSA